MPSNNSLIKECSYQPVVSIVMNCLNGERYLREAIESIYAQTYLEWEIIFWDNASTDKSSEIALSYDDGRLRYFQGLSTVPLGHARNLAIEQCRGEYIAFLDCDDLWLPQKLEKQIPLFLSDEKVGLVYADTLFFNESGVKKRHFSNKSPYKGFCFQDLLNRYLISLETAILRRSALDSLEYWFDERFNVIEEYDLFVRIGLFWKVDFVPEVLASWRVHSESLTWRDPDSFDVEISQMLSDLKRNSLVTQLYANALLVATYKLNMKNAVRIWRNGDSRGARQFIQKSARPGIFIWMVWFASFFPYSLVAPIHEFLTGCIRPKNV